MNSWTLSSCNLSALASLPNLKDLTISGDAIPDFSTLPELPSLTSLELPCTPNSRVLERLTSMSGQGGYKFSCGSYHFNDVSEIIRGTGRKRSFARLYNYVLWRGVVVEGIINFEPVDRWVEHFWREWELLKPTNITNSREKFESGFLKHVEEYLDEVVAAANVDSEKSESEISRENSEEDEEDKYTVKRLLDQQKKLVAQQRNLVDRVGNVCEMIKSLVAEFAALKKEVRQMGSAGGTGRSIWPCGTAQLRPLAVIVPSSPLPTVLGFSIPLFSWSLFQ
jgi:hypothetical protein